MCHLIVVSLVQHFSIVLRLGQIPSSFSKHEQCLREAFSTRKKMSEEMVYVSAKRRGLTQASRALNTKNRYGSLQQKYLTYLERRGQPANLFNE